MEESYQKINEWKHMLRAQVKIIRNQLSEDGAISESTSRRIGNYYTIRDAAEQSGVNVKKYDEQIGNAMRRYLRK